MALWHGVRGIDGHRVTGLPCLQAELSSGSAYNEREWSGRYQGQVMR